MKGMTASFTQHLFYQVVQLEELMAVRHSVFILGNAGTGKSQVGFLKLSVKAVAGFILF